MEELQLTTEELLVARRTAMSAALPETRKTYYLMANKAQRLYKQGWAKWVSMDVTKIVIEHDASFPNKRIEKLTFKYNVAGKTIEYHFALGMYSDPNYHTYGSVMVYNQGANAYTRHNDNSDALTYKERYIYIGSHDAKDYLHKIASHFEDLFYKHFNIKTLCWKW